MTFLSSMRRAVCMCAFLLGLHALPAHAATLTVSSLADSGAGTLRDQVAAAAPGDTINFGVTGTIELNNPSISIAKDLTITGPGASNLTISGNGAGNGVSNPSFSASASIFRIGSGVVNISGLKISDGTGDERLGGGIRMDGGTATIGNLVFASNYGDTGGGVYLSGGSMALDGCTFSNNNGPKQGGAIAITGGAMTLTNSILSGNNSLTRTVADGGAIYLSAGNLSINRTSISGSRAELGGGIHQVGGTLNIANSTISGNFADQVDVGSPGFGLPNQYAYGWGGGIFIGPSGTASITNSTISSNSSGAGASGNTQQGGGGIWNDGRLTLSNSTVTGNSANNYGGGILIVLDASTNIFNTIVAGNAAGKEANLYGQAGGDYNLVQSISGTFTGGTHNIYGQDALLGPLQNNGGPTLTHAPLAGSPALDAGDPNFDTSNLPFDQRGVGFPRVKNSRIDIGAVENETSQSGSNLIVNNLDDHDDGICGVSDCTLREAVQYVPAGGTITFSVTGTITLTQGELRIFRDMSFIGPTSAPGITISGNNQSRIFALGADRNADGSFVSPGSGSPSRVNFANLTLRDGNGVGKYLPGNAGALFIDNSIQVGVANCTFSGNSASSISGVTSSGNGGAVRNSGVLTVTNSTFSGNSAGNNGGAIRSGGTLTVINSTFSGNSAGTGRGGGIDNNNGTLNLSNILIAGNSAPTGPDIGGAITSAGYNFVGKGDGSTGLTNGTNGNQVGTSAAPLNPQLGALANNGGPTQTLALLTGSPAINAGSNSLVPSGVTTDQRGVGYARIYGGTVDIGAYELSPVSPTITSFTPTGGPVGTSVTITGTNFSGATDVQFNGTSATTYTVVSNTTITATVPTGATTGTISVTTPGGTATSTGVFTVTAPPLKISEFRLSGPGGSTDEYIELANLTSSPVSLTGYTLTARTVTTSLSGLDLTGKTVPAFGHLLITNSGGYSLGATYPSTYPVNSTTPSAYATGDVQYTGDIALNSTLTLSNNGVTMDSVGDLSATTGLVPTNQYAFVRRQDGAVMVDTDNDTNDFNLVDLSSTTGPTNSDGTSTLTLGARLGAPGPQNSASPVQLAALTLVPLSNSPVTPEGRYASKGTPLDTFGRLSLRRTITNTSNQTIKQIRFTLVRATSGTSSDSTIADLRALTSSGVSYNGSRVCYGIQVEAPTTPTIPGASLTAGTSGNGGGLNSSWNVGTLPAGGLAPGQSINVEFTFGILKEGNYNFALVATVGQ